MSTRSVIARKSPTGFIGVYHHWDGYPDGLGLALLTKLRDEFSGDLPAMLERVIDDHPAGYSNIGSNECFCHPLGKRKAEDAWPMTEKNASGSGAEWAYAFDVTGNCVWVLSSYTEGGDKMIGFFGHGDPNAMWVAVSKIDLADPNRFEEMEAAGRVTEK